MRSSSPINCGSWSANSSPFPVIEAVGAGTATVSSLSYTTTGKYNENALAYFGGQIDLRGLGLTSDGYYIAGLRVVKTRNTGWTAASGVAGNKGAFVAAVAATASAGYVQAEANAANARIAALEARLRAIDDALQGHGLTGA